MGGPFGPKGVAPGPGASAAHLRNRKGHRRPAYGAVSPEWGVPSGQRENSPNDPSDQGGNAPGLGASAAHLRSCRAIAGPRTGR